MMPESVTLVFMNEIYVNCVVSMRTRVWHVTALITFMYIGSCGQKKIITKNLSNDC